jgi:hypothetical protein
LNRQAALRRLIEYADIAGLTEPSEFDSAHAMSFRRWLMGHSQAESAFCQYLVGARLFCRWCVPKG